MGRPRKPSRFPVEQIAAEYQCGDSLAKLGTRYGCHGTYIRRLLLAQGIELRPVPSSVAPLKGHCRHGHAFTPENTYIDRDGNRNCIACKTEWSRAYRARKEKS